MLFRILGVWALGLATLGGWPAAVRAAGGEPEYKPGREYVEMSPYLAEAGDNRIEVLEFFWYGCPHCFAVEPLVDAWVAKLPPDVRFIRLPAVFNDQSGFHARIFLALEAMKKPEAHAKVFRIFQDEGRFTNNLEGLPDLAKDLKLNPQAFLSAFNSPSVQARMEALDKLMVAYDLPGVPAMVVAGRYRFDIGTARGPAGFLKLADFLIERERRTRAGGNRPAGD